MKPSQRPGEVMKPYQMAGRGQEALLEGREDQKSLPESQEGWMGRERSGGLQEGWEWS